MRTEYGIRSSCRIRSFEDQRSGETLGKLQKVRTDVEKLINISVNLLFTTLIGVVFVMIYACACTGSIAPALPADDPAAGRSQLSAEQADQDDPEGDRQGNHGAGGIHDGIAAQHRAREESWPCASRKSPDSMPRRRRS